MKIGYQTIIWGERIDNLPYVLDCIAACGFRGVEIAQRTDCLGFGDAFTFDQLQELLRGRGLSLVGLANGSLEERMAFCRTHIAPHYLYIDSWNEEASLAAMNRGFVVALHPHAYMPIGDLADAQPLLNRYDKLKWLPDTAHLTIAGEDPMKSLSLPHERIAAVHLKDWTAAYGRSAHRYARGFTELGQGDVKPHRFVRQLQDSNYHGWLIVEQDNTRTTPEGSLVSAAEWLHQHRLLPRPPELSRLPRRSTISVPQVPADCLSAFRLSRQLSLAASQDIENCYRTVAGAFSAVLRARCVSLWIPSLAHGFLSLAAVDSGEDLGQQILDLNSCITGTAIDRHAVTSFDLSDKRLQQGSGASPASYPEMDLAKRIGVRGMLSIPVFSMYNQHHVRLVINVFTTEARPSLAYPDVSSLTQDVANAIDAALDRTCSDASASAARLGSTGRTLSEYASEIASLTALMTRSAGCSLFLSNGAGDALNLVGTTGIQWYVPDEERLYRRGEGLTGTVWQSARVKVSSSVTDEPRVPSKSSEVPLAELRSCVLVPLFDAQNRAVGVVRCQNKRLPHLGGHNIFSDDDVAIIEAVSQIALPHIEALVAEERRRDGVARLAHELQRPATAIRSAVDFMHADLRKRDLATSQLFAFDYLGDVESWSELMIALVENADFYGKSGGSLVISAAPTYLMKDVIAPAVRQVDVLLRNRRFPPRNIRYGRLQQIPQLWVDRSRFQQVMFNLLSNAIKYAYRDASSFQIEIDGERLPSGDYRVFIRDWGEGIPAGFEHRVFEQGFRAPRTGQYSIAGQGLGLWVVSSIVQAHGGYVKVTSRHLPTEISLWLPKSLDHKPPERTESLL